MSRRYGRNQKRAHRERIVELEEENERLRYQLGVADDAGKLLGKRLRAQEQHVVEIAETVVAVVRHSALLPPMPSPVSSQNLFPACLSIALAPKRRFVESGCESTDRIEILRLDLWHLRAIVEERRTAFQRVVHVLTPEGGYMLTMETYRLWKEDHLPEVARQVYRQIHSAVQP